MLGLVGLSLEESLRVNTLNLSWNRQLKYQMLFFWYLGLSKILVHSGGMKVSSYH